MRESKRMESAEFLAGRGPPGFSISVDSKGNEAAVRYLESTLAGWLGSVDCKGVARDFMGRGNLGWRAVG